MATEVASIGVGMETSGIERGVKVLKSLADAGPRVERAMDGVSSAAGKATKNLQGLGNGADKGLSSVAAAAPRAEAGLGRVAQTAEKAKQAIADMIRSAASIGSVLGSTSMGRGFSGVESGAKSAASAVDRLNTVLALAGAGVSVQSLIGWTDGYTKFTAQLRNATDSAGEYAQAMEDVKRISEGAQMGLGELGVLYARISTSTKELGISQERVAQITDTVALSLKANGASASEASSAMLQLSQAFGSGVLRGEEFNAVYEAAPNLLRNLAQAMGVPQGALRGMAEEGKLTADVLAKYLPESLEKVRKEAERMQTIGGSFTVLNNKIMEYIGQSSEASGATSAISAGVLALSNNIDVLATGSLVAATVGLSRYAAGLAAAGVAQGAKVAATRLQAAEDIRLAQAQVAQATATLTQAQALTGLGTGHVSAAAAATAHETAVKRLTVAQTAYSAAGSGVMAFLGGPLGLAVLAGTAATAIYAMSKSSDGAGKALLNLNGPLDDTIKKFRQLNQLQQQNEIGIQTAGLADSLRSANSAVYAFIADFEPAMAQGGRAAAKFRADFTTEVKALVSDTSLSSDDLANSLSSLTNRWADSMGWSDKVKASMIAQATAAANLQSEYNNAKLAVEGLTGAFQNFPSAGGGRGFINPKTVGEMRAELIAEADALIQGTKSYKSRAEAMAEVRAEGQRVEVQLQALKNAGLGASDQAQALESRLVGVNERLKGMQGSGKGAAQSVDELTRAFQGSIKALTDRIAAEQLTLEILQKYGKEAKNVTAIDREVIAAQKALAAATTTTAKARAQAILNANLELQATERASRGIQERIDLEAQFAQMRGNANKQSMDALKSIQDEVAAQERANMVIGLGAKEVALLEAAKYKEMAASKRRLAEQIYNADGDTLEAANYRKAADELERLAMLKEQGAMRQANVDAQKEISAEWDKTSQLIGSTLSDYIMGGGKNAAQYLKRLFATLVLQPIVNYGVQGVMGALGMGGGSGNISQSGGGLMNQLSNSGGGFTNWGAWGTNSATSLGNWGASAINSGFDTVGQGMISLGQTIGELDAWLSKIPGLSGGIGSALGYAGSIIGLINGDYGSAVGSAIGTFLLPGIGTMIGGFLGGFLDWQSTPHMGATGYYTTQGGSENFQAGQTKYNADIGKMVEGLASSVGFSLEKFLANFGLSGNVAVTTNWADDFNGKGNSWGYFALAIQDAMGEWTNLVDWRANNGPEVRHYKEGEAGFEEYALDVYRSFIDGLKQVDIPGWAQDVLDQIGADASLEQINQTLMQLGVMRETFSGWATYISEFANVGDAAFTTLLNSMGGFENLAAGVSSFVDLYYSEQEKLELQQKQLTDQLAKMNVELPVSKEAWRELVDSALDAGEGGAELAALLLSLGPAFSEYADGAAAAAQAQIDEQNRVLEELYSSAGISGATIAQILRDGMLGRLTEDDVGAQLSGHIIDGIYNSLAGGFAQQITDIFTSGIITPLLQAAATGSAMSGVVSQASIDAVVGQARASIAALQAILSDPALQQAIADINATIKDLNIGAPTVAAPSRPSYSGGGGNYGAQVNSDARSMISAWESVYNAIYGSMTKLRDSILGTTEDAGNSFYEAQFAVLTAQARAGDEDAAKRLPELVAKLADYAKGNSVSLFDQNASIAGYIKSLEETQKYVAGLYQKAGGKLSDLEAWDSQSTHQAVSVKPATVPQKVIPTIDNSAMLSSINGNSGNAALLAEMRAMRTELAEAKAELKAMRSSSENIESHARNTSRTLDEVTNGGEAMYTREVKA